MMRPLDDLVKRHCDRVTGLPNWSAALFSACCAERLVGLYAEFVLKEGWGEPDLVRHALDAVWNSVARAEEHSATIARLLEDVEKATPHADDFGSLECKLAQEACACIDAAIRWWLRDADAGPYAVDAAFEAVRASICVSETGFFDLGDTAEGEQFEAFIVHDPRIKKEAELQEHDLTILEEAADATEPLLRKLREGARASRWTTATLTTKP